MGIWLDKSLEEEIVSEFARYPYILKHIRELMSSVVETFASCRSEMSEADTSGSGGAFRRERVGGTWWRYVKD